MASEMMEKYFGKGEAESEEISAKADKNYRWERSKGTCFTFWRNSQMLLHKA
ncbi:MAG: hypothetical protein ACYSYL_09895 [Planctomycetota bacterium]